MALNYRVANRAKTNYLRYYTHFQFYFSLGKDICLRKKRFPLLRTHRANLTRKPLSPQDEFPSPSDEDLLTLGFRRKCLESNDQSVSRLWRFAMPNLSDASPVSVRQENPLSIAAISLLLKINDVVKFHDIDTNLSVILNHFGYPVWDEIST